MVDLAAHALLLGEDWRRVLDMDRGELDELVESAVWQRAVDLRQQEQKNLATMIASAMNGARSLDGRRTPSSTSTRHG